MPTLDLRVYDLFRKRFSEEQARTVITYFETKVEEKIADKKDVFLKKDDKVEIIGSIYKSVYTANIIQFIATIAGMPAIMKFMIK